MDVLWTNHHTSETSAAELWTSACLHWAVPGMRKSTNPSSGGRDAYSCTSVDRFIQHAKIAWSSLQPADSVCSHVSKLLLYVDCKSTRFCILCSSATRHVWPAWGSSVFFLGCGRVTLAFLDLWLKLLPFPHGIIFIIWVFSAEQAFYDSCLQNLFSLKNSSFAVSPCSDWHTVVSQYEGLCEVCITLPYVN